MPSGVARIRGSRPACIEHWEPPSAGLREMCRVTRGPVVVLTMYLSEMPAWQRNYVGGFVEALCARPEALLEPVGAGLVVGVAATRPGVEDRMVDRLTCDLADGTWDAAYGEIRSLPKDDGLLRLVVAEP